MPHAALHAKLVGWFVGTRLSFPTLVAGAWGYGSTLPLSPILRASHDASLRTMGGLRLRRLPLNWGRDKGGRFGSCCGKYDA